MSKMNLLIDLKGFHSNNQNSGCPRFSKNSLFVGIDLLEDTVSEVSIDASQTIELFNVSTANARKFIYLETTGECSISINGVAESNIKPIVINDSVKNGVFLKSSLLENVSITNNGSENITIFYITTK